MRIMIINGPNLNLLGIREPHIYGSTTLDAIQASCEEFASFAGAQLSFHQSNHEGVMVDLIQSARTDADALIINPAAYSFTSIVMFDALKIFEKPIFEVHISNIHARDELHRHSKLSAAVKAVIAGPGPYGYIPCRPHCRAPASCRRRCPWRYASGRNNRAGNGARGHAGRTARAAADPNETHNSRRASSARARRARQTMEK